MNHPLADKAPATSTLPLNPGQSAAVDDIIQFLASDESFYLLQGSAGTGKTFCIRELVNRAKGRFVFTAPTNKATKVLRQSVTTKDYRPDCRTIFSLLGLKLEANGEVKELTSPEDPVDLSDFKACIVDEGSMVNENLRAHIKKATEEFGIKFIFMADFAQLPPVGESRSPISRIKRGSTLTKVERHDNQILELATRLRAVVDNPFPNAKLLPNNANDEGVWSVTKQEFEQLILRAAQNGEFSRPEAAKTIAWRNVTVDRFNKLIRDQIFDKPSQLWLPDDRVLFMAPASDLDDKKIASTDDEGRVDRVEEDEHPLYNDFKIFRISITLDGNEPVVARVLHPDSQRQYGMELDSLSLQAKANRRLWGKFWAFKEAFHTIRHAYALTTHRAQGSTYDTAFVDWRDILLNRDRQEAYRSLYVGCTRPKRKLILG